MKIYETRSTKGKKERSLEAGISREDLSTPALDWESGFSWHQWLDGIGKSLVVSREPEWNQSEDMHKFAQYPPTPLTSGLMWATALCLCIQLLDINAEREDMAFVEKETK